jgi:hypothetical protein
VDAATLSVAALRAKPPWLHECLGLHLDLTVHFIDEGREPVTVTDLDRGLPQHGVQDRGQWPLLCRHHLKERGMQATVGNGVQVQCKVAYELC